MNEAVTGIIHVHSNFSRDGLCSVANLADFAREAGFQFVGLTDHAEDLSPEDMKGLRQECGQYSNESFVMIPGLEFRCSEDFHILGLGIADHSASNDPVAVASQIRAKGGLAILAHPGRNRLQSPQELFGVLNGIEIWNAGYDGRFALPSANLRLLEEAQRVNPAILGFGGADLHWFDQSPGVALDLQMDGSSPLTTETVLQCLESGRFRMRGKWFSFHAHPAPNWLIRSSMWAFRGLYEAGSAIRNVALGKT